MTTHSNGLLKINFLGKCEYFLSFFLQTTNIYKIK